MPKLKKKPEILDLEHEKYEKRENNEKADKAIALRAVFHDPTTYCLLAVTLLFCAYVVSDVTIGLSLVTKVAASVLLFVALYATGAIKSRSAGEKYMRLMYLMMVVIYAYFVISATLLDASLGRGDLKSITDPVMRREYYERWFVNMRPFHTVKTIYIDALKAGTLTLWYVVFNALGNLLILAPFSIFVPASSEKTSKPYIILPILLASTMLIEALQYAFMLGSCDIDDIIFNFVGALSVWAIIQIPPIRRFVKKLTFPSL